jgi:hypothetical protein
MPAFPRDTTVAKAFSWAVAAAAALLVGSLAVVVPSSHAAFAPPLPLNGPPALAAARSSVLSTRPNAKVTVATIRRAKPFSRRDDDESDEAGAGPPSPAGAASAQQTGVGKVWAAIGGFFEELDAFMDDAS